MIWFFVLEDDKMSFVYIDDFAWWYACDHYIHILIPDENKSNKESTHFSHWDVMKIVAKWIMLILLIHSVWLRQATPMLEILFFLHELSWFMYT